MAYRSENEDASDFMDSLRRDGYEIINVAKDGSCMFTSLALGIYQDDSLQRSIRVQVYDHVIYQYEEYSPFIFESGGVRSVEGFRNQVSLVLDDDEWGELWGLIAVSNVCGVNIIVHTPTGNHQIPLDQHWEETIHLALYENHYSLLRRRSLDENDLSVDNISQSMNKPIIEEKDVKEGTESGSNLSKMRSGAAKRKRLGGKCDDLDTSDFENDKDSDYSPRYSEVEDSEYSEDDDWIPLVNPLNDESTSKEVDNVSDGSLSNSSLESDPDSDLEDLNYTESCLSQLHIAKEYRADSEVINARGMKFLLNKVVASSRRTLEVLVLVPRLESKDFELTDHMHGPVKPDTILILMDYAGFLSKIQSDEDIPKVFDTYLCHLPIPLESDDRTQRLANMMLTLLILSASRYTYHGINVKALFYFGKAMMLCFVNSWWADSKPIVQAEVDCIRNNNSIFCDNCSSLCPFKDQIVHFDLQQFKKVEYKEPKCIQFLSRVYMWDSIGQNVKETVFQEILETSISNPTLEAIYKTLDRNVVNIRDIMYSAYLVLLMDGPKMHQYQTLGITELLNTKDVYKCLYSGFCESEMFRSTHFTDEKSAINRGLTKHSVLCLVRVKRCASMWDALLEEAKVIETLKTRVAHCKDKKLPCPYLLLNKRSESSKLLLLSNNDICAILELATSDIPIFKVQDNDETAEFNADDGDFTGNYNVCRRIDLLPGNYESREFDDVKRYYDKLD